MYVKLFRDNNLEDLQDQMNEFLVDVRKKDVVNIDVKMGLTYNQTQEATSIYYTGIIACEGDLE